MRKLSFVVLSLCLSAICLAQTNINDLEKVDGLWKKKGKKKAFSGNFIEYYEDGKTVKGKGFLNEGRLEGDRTMYYESGKLMMERKYNSADSTAQTVEYYENGNIKQKGQYIAGKEDGTWKTYHENGNLQALMTFAKGQKQGDYFEYSEDGNLKAQYYFSNGELGYSPEFNSLLQQGQNLSRRSQNDEAIEAYDKAIKLNPTVAQAYYNRGVSKSNNMDFEAAIKDFDSAIELNPKYTEAYTARGNAKINNFTAKGNLKPGSEQAQSACDDLNKAISLGDKSVETEDMILLYCKRK